MENKNKIQKICRTVLWNADGKLRNGWWMAIFIMLIAATRPLFEPIKQQLLAWNVPPLALEYLPPVLMLLVTWICLRLRRERLASVGLALNSQWMRQFSAGIAFTFVQIIVIAALVYLFDGLSFSLNPERSVSMLAKALYLMLGVVIMEELLFRGFLFQRLLAGTGIWFTQLSLALLFAFAHWGNPGMDDVTQVVASVDLALAALIFGLAYIRTGSLALPMGLHLGWNYFQGAILGFSVSGYETEGWFIPAISDGAVWLNGGEFGLEASIFSPVINFMFLIILWRWKKGVPVTPYADSTAASVPIANAVV